MLSNALKARGFRRPPGSPRLITRLRRIKELTVDRSGTIRLVDAADQSLGTPEGAEGGAGDVYEAAAEADVETGDTRGDAGSVAEGAAPRRRRRRRGGRRRRGRGGARAAAAAP
jgi:hypothetical protein